MPGAGSGHRIQGWDSERRGPRSPVRSTEQHRGERLTAHGRSPAAVSLVAGFARYVVEDGAETGVRRARGGRELDLEIDVADLVQPQTPAREIGGGKGKSSECRVENRRCAAGQLGVSAFHVAGVEVELQIRWLGRGDFPRSCRFGDISLIAARGSQQHGYDDQLARHWEAPVAEVGAEASRQAPSSHGGRRMCRWPA